MSDAKSPNQKSNEWKGWFCVVTGIFVLGMSSRIFIPVLEAMLGPKTGTSGTTIGMGMMIGMPFFVIGAGLLFSGSILVLEKKPKSYTLLFILGSIIALGLLSTVVWQSAKLPHRSPLTQAIVKYSNYTPDQLDDELKHEIGYYDKTRYVGPIVGRSLVKVQALMQVLTDKHPSEAKRILVKISETSKDKDVQKMARNFMSQIKDISGNQHA